MRIARKILLLALTALAAMAFAASSASANSAVEVDTEAGNPCNPCAIHVVGESHIVATGTGAEISTCEDEFNGNIYHNGSGEIEWTRTAHGGPGCNTTNCTVTAGAAHWAITGMEEIGANQVEAPVNFCLQSIAGPPELFCTGDVIISEPTAHDYVFSLTQLCASGTRRVEGSWAVEGSPIEIDHTPGA